MKERMKKIGAALRRWSVFHAIDALAQGEEAVDKGKLIMPFFYGFVLYQAMNIFFSSRLLGFAGPVFDPPLPLFWARFVPFSDVPTIIAVFFMVSSLIAVFLCRYRTGRILGFLGILQYHAYISSFGTRDHGWTLFTAISFFLIFLPSIWNRPSTVTERKMFLAVFWASAASIFLSYALAGTGKLIGAYHQILAGQPSIFSLSAGALHIADWQFHGDGAGLLGPIIMDHLWLGWLGSIAVTFAQFFSWVAAFFPRLYRPWALFIVLIHLTIYLGMGIASIEIMLLIVPFLAESPLGLRPKPHHALAHHSESGK